MVQIAHNWLARRVQTLSSNVTDTWQTGSMRSIPTQTDDLAIRYAV